MHRNIYLSIFIFLTTSYSWPQVIVNEIMYNAPAGGLEYIELWNAGAHTADVGGWILQDDRESHRFRLPAGSSIPAGGYFVIANDAALFLEAYSKSPQADGMDFNFSNEGDSVRLFDSNGRLLESIDYDDRSPWPEQADGQGASLERLNDKLPASLPAAWSASIDKGTPGEKNSAYTDQIPPLILKIDHTPKIPQPNEPITLTAQIWSAGQSLSSVRAMTGWNDGVQFQSAEMVDDGLHGDGEANDGVYGAVIEGGAAGDVFRFYIEAKDASGQASQLPEEGRLSPYLTAVENRLPAERVSIHRVVMLPGVRQEFLQKYTTDEYFPATFYDGDEVYYRVHIRHRGRSRVQNGRFKIRFPHHQLYRGKMRRLNYNGTDANTILREYLSYQLYQDAGLPNLESEIVRFHINGSPAKGTAYRVAIENPDAQFIRRKHYFNQDDGNLYKTTLDGTPVNKATWRYVGENPDLYSGCYIKQTNEEEADYSDIIRFCRVLSQSNTWDEDYVENVYSVLNPDDFLRWMAVSACVAHWDSPYTDHAHNYVLYNNPGTNQFHILAWDLNGTFNYTSNQNDLNYRKLYTHIRSTKFPAINKILNHPVFGAQYFREIDQALDTLFTQSAMNERIEQAQSQMKLSAGSVSFLKTYTAQRIQDLSQWINRDQGAAFISKPVYQTPIHQVYTYPACAVDYRRGHAMRYALEIAPDWLQIDPQTGIISGVPPAEGRYDVLLSAETDHGIRLEQSYSLQVVDRRPRLLMTFNEESGDFLDASDYQHTSSQRGDLRTVQGRLGNAVYLNGSNAYVQIPHADSLSLTGSITVEAWIKPDSISNGNPVIISKGDDENFNYTLMLGYGPFSWDIMEPCFMPKRFDIENRVYYGRKEIEAQLKARQWVHIAGAYDSSAEMVCVYADNRKIVESSNRTLMPENTRPLLIGLGNSRSFRGAVDDVKILPFAKQAFAAGLCISQIDASGISPAQDRVALSLSEHRKEFIDASEFCLYVEPADQWIKLPPQKLSPGNSILWWLDELHASEPLPPDGAVSLYPLSSWGEAHAETILDLACWGNWKPDRNAPGVQAGVWLPGRSIITPPDTPFTLSLKQFADNDDMDLDWTYSAQTLNGPVINRLTVNNGQQTTGSQDVVIALSASGENKPWMLRASNSPAMETDWIPYQEEIPWRLSGGDGMKTVYIQAADSLGGRSAVASVNIFLQSNTEIHGWRRHESNPQ
ncbi:MAG: CotH kinase family protein [Candidatus Omnitrophica bacterium]|nr:CotH kinase family protein [Candidatus Omnitrophota bacterium]